MAVRDSALDAMDKTGNIVSIKTERAAYGGLAIGRLDGRVVMVKGAAPGETVEARVDGMKKDYYTATAVSVTEPSPDRVTPPCPYFGTCGGCQLQYMTYARQVAVKQEVLTDCMRRMAKLDVALSDPLTGASWAYRSRGQFKVDGAAVGFYRERSRNVVDIDACPLMVPEINRALADARNVIRNAGISELHISYGTDAVALIRPERGARGGFGKLAERLIGAGLAGVCVDERGRKPAVFGRGYMELSLDGLRYTVSPSSFFQSNWGLNVRLVRAVRDGLGPLSGKRVLDLYSGAGNFTLPLAMDAAEVVAVEDNASAVADGRRNAKHNGISNVRFVKADAGSLDAGLGIDVLVTDPPRPGLTNSAIEKVLAMRPERIAYISCNPSTLARDLKKLCYAYELESIRLVDFFPQTYHIEALAILGLR